MRSALVLVLAVAAGFTAVSAQQQNIQMTQRQQSGSRGDASPKEPPKLTPEQRERAMQLLDGAAAGATSLDSGSRAYALLQVARAYQSIDKKKSIELLEQAMTAASEVGRENDRLKRVGSRLQEQILKAMVPLAPEKVDDLLTQLDARGREQVLQALLDYYQREKKMDRALEVIYRMGAEGEIPYGAASELMSKMKPEQAPEKQRLFTAALASYRDHDHTENMAMGRGDFGEMITRFSHDLPPSLIHQAIEVVLDGARKEAEKQSKESGGMTYSVASAQGAVMMNSVYQYRLFQLLPTLRSIDPDEADRLLKEQSDVQTLLAKYPQGMESVAPTGSVNRPGGSGGPSFMISGGGPGPGGPGGGGGGGRPGPGPGMNPLEMQKSAKISEDAVAHPQDALANASSLQDPGIRANAYISIARANWKKQPSVAKQALDKAADTIDKLEGEQQVMQLGSIVSLYQRMGETDEAKKFIEKGMDAAAKIYKEDSNADDPNQAPRAYWPSIAGWRSMLSSAVEISPVWATTLLKEIPDDEARTLAQLAMATEMLHAGANTTEIMTFTKDGARMMVMQAGPNSDQ